MMVMSRLFALGGATSLTAEMVLPLLLSRSVNISMKAVVVMDADRRAASSPGFCIRSVIAADANVSGLSSTISLSATA